MSIYKDKINKQGVYADPTFPRGIPLTNDQPTNSGESEMEDAMDDHQTTRTTTTTVGRTIGRARPTQSRSRSNSVDAGGVRKARLNQTQKNKNHVDSERRRRDKLHAAFEELAQIIPGMSECGKSHAHLLTEGANWFPMELMKMAKLKAIALERGWSENQFVAAYDFEGIKARQSALREVRLAAAEERRMAAEAGAEAEQQMNGIASVSD